MHKCHFAGKVNDYLDNQLAALAKARFEEHLKICPVCSGEVERLSKLREQLKTWQVPEAGEGFESSVRNKIVAWELERGDEKMKNKTSVIWVPAGVLVGVIVFFFVGQVYFKRGVQGKLQRKYRKNLLLSY
ncbi:MAG: zf-HC2 domain-containing protein [Candidatus Omnitrophica bacterium]|nr:zf-HC2 domain-containing protein [Candidatus Omnitrophota bacterium]